jgi:putative endonuclease
MSCYLYILLCSDGSYYAGTTRGSLETRASQHDTGYFGGHTASRRPVKLVFAEEFANITDAIAAERQIEGWSRAKKEALIHGDLDLLRKLAKRKGGKK